LKEGEVKELNIILKTDVSGTAEVVSEMMQKLSNDKVRIHVLRAGVGAINESDVLLASASNAIIVGFNVRPERKAAELAGCRLDEMVHVGDREHNDIVGAKGAGTRAVLFTGVVDRGSANTCADAVCRDFAQLPAIIDSLAGC
jgi:ribonucleotide monophosphatase NagD (HAD superfamily)